jgi:hypothetical protein
MRLATTVAATAAALVTASLLAPVANAAGKPWGTLYAVDRGNKAAAAYGDFANNGGVYATVGANWADMLNDGNAVYVQADFSFWERNSQGEWDWVPDPSSRQTPRSSRFKYVSGSLSVKLHANATQARAAIKVCEDINLTTDICSPYAILSFSY